MSSSVGMPLLDRRRSSQFEPVLLDRFEQIIMGGRWTEKMDGEKERENVDAKELKNENSEWW